MTLIIIISNHSPQASTSSHGMLTLDLVTEEDGFFPDYNDDSRESWENSFRVDLQRGGSCGQVAVVGSRRVGGRQRAGTDVSKLRATSKEPKVKTGSLPRGSERTWGKQSHLEASRVLKTQQVEVGKPLLTCIMNNQLVHVVLNLRTRTNLTVQTESRHQPSL